MFVAFDMLLLGASDLMVRQFAERRICLEHSVEPRLAVFELASALTSQDPDEILQFLDESIAQGCEGLMIKSAESVYEPSKRSTSWLKLKKDYIDGIGDTLDLVPIGAWLGKGKRHGSFGSYLLACYNADKQTFESIARVGTGLSDEDLDTFWTLLNETGKCRQQKPETVLCSPAIKPHVWIVPSSVWEIKAADLTLSPIHSAAQDFVVGSGVSLRFPRFVRVRDDKGISDATTSRQVMQMYLEQSSVKSGK
jgi:DNA ligase-1